MAHRMIPLSFHLSSHTIRTWYPLFTFYRKRGHREACFSAGAWRYGSNGSFLPLTLSLLTAATNDAVSYNGGEKTSNATVCRLFAGKHPLLFFRRTGSSDHRQTNGKPCSHLLIWNNRGGERETWQNMQGAGVVMNGRGGSFP